MVNSLAEQLNISQEELNAFLETLSIDPIEISSQLCGFDSLYNGYPVENPANGSYYYILNFQGKIYLQNIAPYVEWLIAITDSNKDEVIQSHIQHLQDEYAISQKYIIAIDHFSLSN